MTTYYENELGMMTDSQLEAIFDEAREMNTKDAYGRECHLLNGLYYKKLAYAWRMREVSYGDGKAMEQECYHRAAYHFRKYADHIDS
jgi:hypothetical protein